MKLMGKLLLIGALAIIVPVALIGFFSIYRSSAAMTRMIRGELETRTYEMAQGIENMLGSEKKIIQGFAASNSTIRFLEKEMTEGFEASADEYNELNEELARYIANTAFSTDYEAILVINRGGNVIASSIGVINIDVSTRDYFIGALGGKTTIGSPAISKASGDPFIGIAAPVVNSDGDIIGVTAQLAKLALFGNIINQAKIGTSGYAVLNGPKGETLVHPNPDLTFKVNVYDTPGMEGIGEMITRQSDGLLTYTFRGVEKIAAMAFVPSTGWGVNLSIPVSDFMSPINGLRNLILIIGIAAFVAAFIVFLLVSRGIAKPLRSAAEYASVISGGDLSKKLDVRLKDEVGDLSRALGSMVDNLHQVVGDIQNASSQVKSGSEQMSSAAEQLSQGASQQAASIEEVGSSMEQMKSNISQNADNAEQTEKIALQAATRAEESGKEVVDAVDAIKLIAEKIGIIEEIARQTNMLSLNASIEAARAGDHGKGFAVVAAEVGKLAARSKDAANEIGDLSASTVSTAERAGEVLSSLVPEIRKTADLVQEISASSREQNAGADQINSALAQLDMVIQRNASASEELASLSEELTAQASDMQTSVAYFTLTGDRKEYTQPALPLKKAEQSQLPADSKPATSAAAVSETESGENGKPEQGITLAEERLKPDYEDMEHF